MSTTKHSDGPWFVQDGSLTVYNLSQINSGITCAIAATLNGNGDFKFSRMKANARLIAAAPDLLTALKGTVSALEGCANYLDFYRISQLQTARVIIAKAEGVAP